MSDDLRNYCRLTHRIFGYRLSSIHTDKRIYRNPVYLALRFPGALPPAGLPSFPAKVSPLSLLVGKPLM